MRAADRRRVVVVVVVVVVVAVSIVWDMQAHAMKTTTKGIRVRSTATAVVCRALLMAGYVA